MLLHLAYVVWVGGDFMVGRFLTAPLAVTAVLVARCGSLRRSVLVTGCAALLVAGLARPHSPLRAPLDYPGSADFPWTVLDDVVDERAYYYPFTGLLSTSGLGGPDRHPWALQGRRASAELEALHPGERMVVTRDTIGMFGYFADPRLHVVDRLALSDPLLARLPVTDPEHVRVGHFTRPLPDGYLETLRTGDPHLADPDVAALYEHVRLLTRAELFSARRLRALVATR